ncbi:coiled-coil domain-containing protein 170 [Triplophysa dalaica]|uniref:coiled-coil domain-containing protein 170 n=1 Tax=Triplophysa dalaica TaxID=1582913 RepID=UPI0024E02F30|nr:coiled-coil domain-containing protein 170 [Triplophysa dalaica]XP_056624638.1 coiled-coil domain-containing protein 170 [Triplophysa dalaica]
MEESLIQQHLSHYKQATETAREELAALQAKYQSLQSQVSDAQSKAASHEETIKHLKDVIDRHKEKEARQESLIGSLRERIYNTEQEMLSITSSRSIMDMRVHTLAKENEEVKEKLMELDIKSKQYFAEWNKAKQEASETRRRSDEFISTIANKVSMNVSGKADAMDYIVSTVETCFKENERLKNGVCDFEESLRSYEVECKASRGTVKRLATDVEHEQTLSASRLNELNSVRQELDFASLKKLSLERENQTLQTSLQETQQALASAQQRCSHYENLSQDLDQKLHSSQNETQVSHSHHGAFMKELETLLHDQCLSHHPTPEDLLKSLAAVCTREKSVKKSYLEMEGRLAELEQEVSKHKEHQRSAEQREQKLLHRIQDLEDELLTAGVCKDGMSQEKHQYLRFLEQLSEKLKVEHIAADLGFDMRLEAVLARAQQLTRQEGTAVLETRTQVHNLQRKLKEQRQRSDSKELHLELLMRKVSLLEEEKRSRSALAVEKDDASLTCKKLQKRVDRLQAELSTLRFSNTELKAQLSHTHELKIKVMEQNQTIEEQSKNLSKLEKNNVKTEMNVSTMRSDLQNLQLRAREESQQTQRLLNTQSSAITELAHTEKQLLDFHTVVCQMLGVDGAVCIPNNEVLRRLEVLIQSCRCHHAAHLHHQHHMWESPVSFINAAHPPASSVLPARVKGHKEPIMTCNT